MSIELDSSWTVAGFGATSLQQNWLVVDLADDPADQSGDT
jgi:hypothetical protein